MTSSITESIHCLYASTPTSVHRFLSRTPKDRKYWTEEEATLVSGYPMKPEDQDTYEALMTPERKEIEFWERIGRDHPLSKECGIDWDGLVEQYHETVKREADELFPGGEQEIP